MQIFRLHIRPKGGLADPAFSFAYCLREQILGLGWQIEPPPGTVVTWELYEQLALAKHTSSDLSRVRFLHQHVQPNNLIWTRDTSGKYYLAQVQSPWEYVDTEDSRNADMVNRVQCRILEIPQADDVPGKIVASFRPNRAIQGIRDPTAFFYSQLLWNQLTESEDYSPESIGSQNIFSYLDAETTEDVIFLYLQMQDWLVIPNSRKADTMSYEFVAIHRDTSERAIVQVKTGRSRLNREGWENFDEKIFLFQSNGLYYGAEGSNVICLQPRVIEEFMQNRVAIMPRAVERWMRYVEEHDT